MRRVTGGVAVLAAVGLGGFWVLTQPNPLPEDSFAGLTPDPVHGEQVFTAAGCASCHMAEGAKDAAQQVLGGGQRFPSAFGTFVAPNISSDPDHGIGGWSLPEFADAIQRGIGREGEHLYPAQPYAAYQHMESQDVADLYAYMQTLPPDATPSQPHELAFPFTLRRGIGLWKALYVSPDWVIDAPDLTAEETRGRYIAEALAHCGECHTPRNALGGLDRSRWLAGAPNPSGEGRIPNITPAKLTWSADEVVEYLTTGFTPEYDSVGGHMAHVVENMAKLPEADRRAVVAYLGRVPARD